MRKTFISLLAAAAVTVPAAANATVTAWNGSGASDSISWGQLGPDGTYVSPGTTVTSTGGINATVTNDTGGQMQRLDQGSGWAGSFANGTQLLYNNLTGALTIDFLTPVFSAGALIQANYYGDFTATVTTNDGSSFSVNGNSNGCGCNSNPFLGVFSDSADITSISFTTSNSLDTNDFAIGPLELNGVPGVPEPATWAMMIIGFGAIGLSMRSRRRAATATQLA
jgi:hypothetical protein